MKLQLPVVCTFCLLWSGACAGAPEAVSAPAPEAVANSSTAAPQGGAKADGADEAEAKAKAREEKQKQLQQKKRDLDYAKVEVQTAAIERQVRTMGVETAVADAQLEVDKKRKALDLFLQRIKPRELEEQRIGLDAQTYRAAESKAELAELEAMYKEDEFASATKELVVQRGRRQMELADRRLAVTRQEFDLFEQHTLPDRERDLRQELKQAEQGLEKARLEHQKAQLELGVQQRKADDRVTDLQQEIVDLERELGGAAK
ncbi:MAG: hypothetical protein AB7O97_20255 [Planctomycetota bacterium]